MVADVAANSARLTEAVIERDETGPVTDAVALNAAMRIYAGGDADSLAEGVDMAKHVLADGQAVELLAALRAFEPTGDEAVTIEDAA